MYRVRRIVDGKYLRVAHVEEPVGEGAVVVRWTNDLATATEWPAPGASCVANAMIVINNDRGIEIEPV
jgi:hypothetical protein